MTDTIYGLGPTNGEDMDEQEIRALSERMQKLELWAAQHDGAITEKWRHQDGWNKEHDESDREAHLRWEKTLHGFNHRLEAVEKKVMYISGIMAAVGATAGTLLSHLFS